MKKVFLLSMICVYSLFSMAQKPESEKVKITYTRLPLKPLELTTKKVAIKLHNNSGAQMPPKESLLKYLKMDGFQVTNQNPDAILVIVIDKVTPSKQVLSKFMGNNVTSYFYKVSADMEASVRFLSADTKYEYYRTSKFDNDLSVSKESSYFPNEKAANDALVNENAIENIIRQCFEESVGYMTTYINKNFTYYPVTESFPVYTIKSKDFDYAELDQAQAKYIQAMTQYSTSGLTDDVKTKLNEVIATWAKNIGEYNAEDKKARISSRNILELYMNMTFANIWLRNYPEAKKYFELAVKEKGHGAVKSTLNSLIESGEVGFAQNTLREKNQLNIEKAESEMYSAADFRIESNAYRIKYIEYYNPDSYKRLHHRKVFEYDMNGLVKKIYTQNYDANSKTFFGENDVYHVAYDNKDKVMSFFKKGSQTPESYQTVKNGKLITKSGKDESKSFTYTFNYDKSGNLTSYVYNEAKAYVSSEQNVKKKTRIFYEGGKVKEIVTREMKEKDSIPDQKCVINYSGNQKTSADFYSNWDKLKDFGSKASSQSYYYDATGKLIKIGAGYGPTMFTYDNFGNIIDRLEGSDDGSARHESYVWEEGSGNASLCLGNPNINEHPAVQPQVY